MHTELHQFLARLAGVVVITLVPVVFTALIVMPASLNRHSGEPAQQDFALPQHMT